MKIAKPITEADIDHRIQSIGIRLGPGQEALRKRTLRELQLERERMEAWENSRPSVPLHLFDWKGY